jgi:phosphomevalonate kinase
VSPARRFVAPGKVVVLGEYAVLDGAPALVLAVDRGVSCTVTPAGARHVETPGSDDRFVGPALDAAEAPAARYHFAPTRDPGSGAKVGLGGSAAATTVAVLAALAISGRSHHASALFALARPVHRQVQGSGSGIDVAASAYGGLLRYVEDRPEPLPAPTWSPTIVWSGASARTGPRVERYRAWTDRASFVARTTELVAAFAEAPVPALRRARRLLEAMATAAGVDYRTPALDRIADLAEAHGGAAKPSGAGGGDIAIAIIPDPDARVAFVRACADEGLVEVPVDLAPGAQETSP